jgi:hypothetical protein
MAPAHDAGENSSRLELIHGSATGFAHMDIVLVHGLGGEKRNTWTKSVGKKSYFWPDWIAGDTALKSARVYLFGYKASKNWKPYRKSIAEPGDFARQLLGALRERDQNVRELLPRLLYPKELAHFFAEVRELTIPGTHYLRGTLVGRYNRQRGVY